jgi:transposase-like protein
MLDDMRMSTACFARAPQRCTSSLSKHFLLTFQQVTPLSKTRNQLKVKGEWRYLYRAVDKQGQTIDFLLTEHRDKAAALRFLKQAIRRNGLPETITIDGSDANEAAIKSYNEEHGTAIIIRQVKYLNNMVEQDHRGVKRVTRPMLGFKSFEAA